MSVTSKVLNSLMSDGRAGLVAKGSVSGANTSLYLYWDVDVLSGNAWWKSTSSSPSFKMYVDGVLKSVTWSKSRTETYVNNNVITKGQSSSISISKPFFKLTIKCTDGTVLYDHTFSFYDIENCPTDISADGGEMNGSSASIATLSNYLGTLTTDGSTTVTWKLGTRSYSNSAVTRISTASYKIPSAWCDQVSSASSSIMTVSAVVKYGGVSYKTLSCTLKVVVPDSYLPTISSVTLADVVGTSVPSTWGKVFVQGQSGLRITAITCAASVGASVSKIKMDVETQTSGTITYNTSSLPSINRIFSSGALQVTVTITDSRGRTASKTATVNFIPWSSPKFTSIDSGRCDKSGEQDNDGTYFLSESAVEYSACTGLNKVTLKVQWKLTSSFTYGAQQTITPGTNICGGGNIDTEYSYDVKYTLSDAFTTITYIDYVSTAIYLMHFLHGGRGVAFGQKATMENTLDCAFKAVFRDGVTFVKSDGTEVTMAQILTKLGL